MRRDELGRIEAKNDRYRPAEKAWAEFNSPRLHHETNGGGSGMGRRPLPYPNANLADAPRRHSIQPSAPDPTASPAIYPHLLAHRLDKRPASPYVPP